MKNIFVGMLFVILAVATFIVAAFMLPYAIGFVIHAFYTRVLKKEWNGHNVDDQMWFVGFVIEAFIALGWVVGDFMQHVGMIK